MNLAGARDSVVPKLTVTTVPLEQFGTPLEWLDPSLPLVFERAGTGVVGRGVAAQARFLGPHRISDATTWWSDVVALATFEGDQAVARRGLVAFGTFSFDEHSAKESTLIVPHTIVQVDDSGVWLTVVHAGQSNQARNDLEKTPNQTSRESVLFGEGLMNQTLFTQTVLEANRAIESGSLQKVVLARDIVAQTSDQFSPASALDRLAKDYPGTFVFSVDGFFGASPETLCSVRGKTLTLTVLAGSIKSDADALLQSAKDQDEHRFAVASVVDALEAQGLRVSVDETPHVVTLRNLLHLGTDVYATLPPTLTSLDIVYLLHPTAAVAGTPTEEALAFIREKEPFDRGRYAGPVGWINAEGDGDWAVGIRSAQWDPKAHTLTAYAGAGIVEGSTPESELLETDLKFEPIRHALGS